ncbi:MAG: hypothetical protein Q9211_005224 [Gyalolechia sp. 1 TL-2023]
MAVAAAVSPQDALIGLGGIANVVGFFHNRIFRESLVLADLHTAVIAVINVGAGPDQFSFFDIASQAIAIIHYCIIQQPPAVRLGGAIEVGSQNNFRVVVQARVQFEKNLPEAS